MILISNRGNLNGPNPDFENKQDYIQVAINKGYNVKIDLWLKDGKLYLGSDSPQYELDIDWLSRNNSKVWIQCRDIELLERLIELDPLGSNLNIFTYNGEVTLTSKCYIWGNESEDSIALLGPKTDEEEFDYNGICSDHIENYG